MQEAEPISEKHALTADENKLSDVKIFVFYISTPTFFPHMTLGFNCDFAVDIICWYRFLKLKVAMFGAANMQSCLLQL